MRYLNSAIGAVLCTSQLIGCASIVNGHNQSVSVETRTDVGAIVGASCSLANDKGTWFVTTPGSTIVNRSYENLSVRCEKEGQNPGLVSAKSSTKAMAFGNIIFGGIIGVGVDVATGAAYDYPPLISVIMGKTAILVPIAPAAAGSNTTLAQPMSTASNSELKGPESN
jgi:hypothetical protein